MAKSTWRAMRHGVNNFMRDATMGASAVLDDMTRDINDSIDEGLRDDIPADETEEERLQREQEELEEREREEQERLDEEERLRQEEEEEWQREQDELLAKEAQEQGTLSRMYDAFRASSFYDGYVTGRNLVVGTALVGAGLGMSVGIGVVPVAAAGWTTGKEIVNWAKDVMDRNAAERNAEATKDDAEKNGVDTTHAEKQKAEVLASQGAAADQLGIKPEVGTAAYANVAAKAKTQDQKQAETIAAEEVVEDEAARSGQKVDPEYVKQTAEELVAGLEQEKEDTFDFSRGG